MHYCLNSEIGNGDLLTGNKAVKQDAMVVQGKSFSRSGQYCTPVIAPERRMTDGYDLPGGASSLASASEHVSCILSLKR